MMKEENDNEGAKNAKRAQEKADSLPTRTDKKADPEDRSVDRSRESKEAAEAKVEQQRPGAGP
ncbi:MAG: hypothetical protein IT343_16435 [Candidatus Melainabacteria bacterium]|jgi:hypothetical protein|nr:hypothetical protein [Candidatus Melainabacteria bacterium]